MKKELKPFKKKAQPVAITFYDGSKHNLEIEVEFVNYPLADLLNLRDRLKRPTLFQRLFKSSLYNKYALRDVEEALNQVTVETKYEYIKEIR